MAEQDGKYCYSLDGESYTGELDTREEAIKEGNQYAYEMEHKVFYIGVAYQDYYPSVDVDLIIENIVDNAISNCGEFGEDYLDDIPKEHLTELEEKMNNVLSEWIEKHEYQPTFYSVKDEEELQVVEPNKLIF